MNQTQEDIREQQKQSWNKFSGGWEKWDERNMNFLGPAGKEIISYLQPAGNDHVLDIAAGTGEPGLTIAGMLKGGKVTITDLAEDMLEVAKKKAAKKSITNIETVACDVSEMPFADNSFDAISCRFGFMFFPDMLLAAKEMARVVKPGGRIAASVWNVPEKNFWVTAIMGTIGKNMTLPPPIPGAPGMFRCADPGFMTGIFEEAGLKNTSVKEVSMKLHCGTLDNYWNWMNDVGAPIVAALSKADDALRNKIRDQVYGLVKEKYPGDDIAIDASSWVICGIK